MPCLAFETLCVMYRGPLRLMAAQAEEAEELKTTLRFGVRSSDMRQLPVDF